MFLVFVHCALGEIGGERVSVPLCHVYYSCSPPFTHVHQVATYATLLPPRSSLFCRRVPPSFATRSSRSLVSKAAILGRIEIV